MKTLLQTLTDINQGKYEGSNRPYPIVDGKNQINLDNYKQLDTRLRDNLKQIRDQLLSNLDPIILANRNERLNGNIQGSFDVFSKIDQNGNGQFAIAIDLIFFSDQDCSNYKDQFINRPNEVTDDPELKAALFDNGSNQNIDLIYVFDVKDNQFTPIKSGVFKYNDYNDDNNQLVINRIKLPVLPVLEVCPANLSSKNLAQMLNA